MAKRDISGAVDFAYLERFAAGDSAVIEEVLEIFPEQAALWIRLLDPTGPADSWRDGAHTMKGAALGVGAFQLAEVCGEAEAQAEGPLGRRITHLSRVRTALDAALADIAAYSHERALRSLRRPG